MKIVDANVILRYLLGDIENLSKIASDILEKEQVYIPNEIIAEVVYVLEKVYNADRNDICTSLKELFNYSNIKIDNLETVTSAMDLFIQRRLDFVDTLLFGYNKIENYEIITFDKKLDKVIKHE